MEVCAIGWVASRAIATMSEGAKPTRDRLGTNIMGGLPHCRINSCDDPHGFDNTQRQMQRSYPYCCSLVVASSAPMRTFISSGRMDDCSPANHEE